MEDFKVEKEDYFDFTHFFSDVVQTFVVAGFVEDAEFTWVFGYYC